MAMQEISHPQIERLPCMETGNDNPFDSSKIPMKSFDFQYYLLYKSRLQRLRPILEQLARQQWDRRYPLCARVLDAETSAKGKEVVIFGTLYKEMNKKKSVLEEYHDEGTAEKEESKSVEAKPGRFISEDDYLMIEDEHGSLRITGKCLNVHKLFTGFVVALKGILYPKEGIFHVSSYLLPGIPDIYDPLSPQSAMKYGHNSNCNNFSNSNENYNRNNSNSSFGRYNIDDLSKSKRPDNLMNSNSNSSNKSNNNSNDKTEYIGFLSDLRFADVGTSTDINLNNSSHLNYQLMFDNLSGFLCNYNSNELNKSKNNKIIHLIIAGNVLGEDEMPDELDDMRYSKKYLREIDLARQKLDFKLKDLDLWLLQLSNNISIDIMPGKIDPTNELLPQIKFHKCLFPLSTQYNRFNCVSNPYSTYISNGNNNNNNKDKLKILGCSGQNIDNMVEHGIISDLECLELTLKARNIAPTAPDTLTCFPYQKNDPFLIEKCPNIYFVGSRKKFDSKIIYDKNGNKALILCIPSFYITQQIVLVNKNTLECKIVSFENKMY